MPLSEFHSDTKGKLETTQSKMINCLSDPSSFIPDQEFVELLWENGQVVMQGQSNRPGKSSLPTVFASSCTTRVQERESRDAVISRIGRYGAMDSIMNNFTTDGPSGQTRLSGHENEMVPWLNHPVVMQGQSNRPRKSSLPTVFSSSCTARVREKEGRDAVISRIGRYGAMDSIMNDFATDGLSGPTGLTGHEDEMVPWLNHPVDDLCSELLSEFSGVNVNSLSTHNSMVPMPVDRSSGFIQEGRDSHNVDNGNASKALSGGCEPPRARNSQLCQFPQQYHSFPSIRSRALDFLKGNNTSIHPIRCGDLLSTKTQEQDLTKPLHPSSSEGLMNFSHFSRPVALVKANLQNFDRLRSNEKASTTTSSNPMESTVIESSNGLKSGSGVQGQVASIPANMEIKTSSQPPQKAVTVEHSEPMCQEGASKSANINTATKKTVPDHINCQSSSFAASIAVERQATEKGPEPVIASSSVCSGKGAGASAGSNDPKHRAKRKTQEREESGYQSEDLDDESVGLKKPATGRGNGTKRSRAAEVHNLSERRRRDRINEKMRALQELIPNCNKVDKASMLDEAIDYLKTLQMQVQIMSMGSGLCIPPMMLPSGMQHIRAPHMAHFSPMGVGMGMGMGLGFGLGMLDMSGSPVYPLIPVPPVHGAQFPCSSIPGTPGLQGMPGSNSLHMFGIPGQGLPMSMPNGPPFVPVSGLFTKLNSVPEESVTTASMAPAADSAPSLSLKDQQTQTIERAQKTSDDGSHIQTSVQETKDYEESTLVQASNQTSNVSGYGAINSIS